MTHPHKKLRVKYEDPRRQFCHLLALSYSLLSHALRRAAGSSPLQGPQAFVTPCADSSLRLPSLLRLIGHLHAQETKGYEDLLTILMTLD